MKSLHPKLARRHDHAERFLREVQVTGRLDHPNIVPVHDIGFHSEGNAFFLMKHVDGRTLTEVIGEHRDQPLIGSMLEEHLRIFLKLTNAISFAHSRGVIHRDLKPNNIMVGTHGEVYVMDWGIALLCEDTGEQPERERDLMADEERLREQREFNGSLLGTIGYMSPEQADGRVTDIDYRTDVFGLGAILYEILTGRAPYSCGSRSMQALRQARAGAIKPPAEVTTRHLPPGLCRIAMKAMAKDPDDRYQSVRDLEHAVTQFLRGGGWFETRTIPAGTVIVQEGDEAYEAYIIESGHCEVFKTGNVGRRTLRELGPGDVFGETAIFTGKARTASVAARDEVKVVVITRESLDYELSEKGWLAAFVRALAERFADIDQRLSALIAAGAAGKPDKETDS
jgi:serine/threonine-protein kinase